MSSRGSVSLFFVGFAAIGAVLIVMGINTALVLNARARAQVAADAAALAAAPLTFHRFGSSASPREEATRFASANGATLVSCLCPVDRTWRTRTVEVEVAITRPIPGFPTATIKATARAEFTPVGLLSR